MLRKVPDQITPWDEVYQKGEYLVDSGPLMLEWAGTAFRFDQKPVILDIGCGYGKLALQLADRGAVVHVCDIAETPIKALQNEPRIASARVCSADDLSAYPDEMFDGAVSNGVLQYLPPDRILRALKEVGRILKPGGLFFCNFPTTEDYKALSEAHTYDARQGLTFLSPGDVCSLYAQAQLRLNMLARRPDIEAKQAGHQWWYAYACKPNGNRPFMD